MKNFIIERTFLFNLHKNSGINFYKFRKNMVIFTGNSNKALAEQIAEILKVDLGAIKVGRFSDG